jgi:hypothetical protein
MLVVGHWKQNTDLKVARGVLQRRQSKTAGQVLVTVKGCAWTEYILGT